MDAKVSTANFLTKLPLPVENTHKIYKVGVISQIVANVGTLPHL